MKHSIKAFFAAAFLFLTLCPPVANSQGGINSIESNIDTGEVSSQPAVSKEPTAKHSSLQNLHAMSAQKPVWEFLRGGAVPVRDAATTTGTGGFSTPAAPLKSVRTGGTLFYSNIFESIIGEGILFSTLDPEGKTDPRAHLGYDFQTGLSGPSYFDFFGHHRMGTFDNGPGGTKTRRTFTGKVYTLLYNPGEQNCEGEILQNITSSMRENGYGKTGGGPGELTAKRILRNQSNQKVGKFSLHPGEFKIINRWSGGFAETHNTQIYGRLDSGELRVVEAAVRPGIDFDSMDMQALDKYIAGLKLHPLSPTDHPYVPSDDMIEIIDLNCKPQKIAVPKFMGRAGGISVCGAIRAILPEFDAGKDRDATYPINTTPKKLFGQAQMQSVPFIRYYDHETIDAKTGLKGTLSSPHNYGNYGVRHTFEIPLANGGKQDASIKVLLGCPTYSDGSSQFPGYKKLSEEERLKVGLPSYYLRTDAMVSEIDGDGRQVSREIVHINQTAGEASEIIKAVVSPGKTRRFEVRMIGTGDSTPNHVLTVMNATPAER